MSAAFSSLDMFVGKTTASVADIYVRLENSHAHYRLSGQITGPVCSLAKTLRSTFSIKDLGPGESMLATARIIDPCYWTSRNPMMYQAQVQLVGPDNSIVDNVTTEFGIRDLECRSTSFYWDSRRWVLRAVEHPSDSSEEAAAICRDLSAALAVTEVTEQIGQWSARHGVVLSVWVDSEARLTPGVQRRLASIPSVAFCVLPANVPSDKIHTPTNVLYGHRLTPQDSNLQSWAQFVVVRVEHVEVLLEEVHAFALPVVVERVVDAATSRLTLEEKRRAVDHLQREVAPWGDFAGYVVRTNGS